MEGKTLGTSWRRGEKEGGPEAKEWGREGRVATKSEPPVQIVTPNFGLLTLNWGFKNCPRYPQKEGKGDSRTLANAPRALPHASRQQICVFTMKIDQFHSS